MEEKVEGLPEGVVSADLEAMAFTAEVDEAVYPLEAVYGAAYTFIDRCYVLIDRPRERALRITLTPKRLEGAAASALRDYGGELLNELLACAWRAQIARENRVLIETVTQRAVGAAMGPPTLDDLAAFDFADEAFEDPLGIAMSWEEKYKKKKEGDAAPKAEGEAGGGAP